MIAFHCSAVSALPGALSTEPTLYFSIICCKASSFSTKGLSPATPLTLLPNMSIPTSAI